MTPELLVHCTSAIDAHKPVLLALFLGGLTGSVSHCLSMCSPFVLAQSEKAKAGFVASLLLPYHMGRITTYMLLGTVSAALASTISAHSGFALLSKWLLATAGCLFLVAMLHRLPLRWPLAMAWAPRCSMKYLQRLAGVPGFFGRFGMGMLLGFIPCGMIVAALMAVASTGSAFIGAAGMLLFGLATVPALLTIGLAGRMVSSKYASFSRHMATAAMGVNSILLFTLAGH